MTGLEIIREVITEIVDKEFADEYCQGLPASAPPEVRKILKMDFTGKNLEAQRAHWRRVIQFCQTTMPIQKRSELN